MTVIRNNSISGINSITAQSGALNFYDSTGNTLSIGASVSGNITGDVTGNVTGNLTGNVTGNVTVATGATISGSTNTITASTNGSERLRITSSGNVGIGTDNPFDKLQVRPGANANFSFSTASSEASLEIINDAGSANVPLNVRASEYKIKIQGTEKVSITSGGNVQIANGNLVFSTAGTGIDFSADSNAAGMTSELLDDYEEGSWTPLPVGLSNTPTWDNQKGRYTKIGRLVHLKGFLQVGATAPTFTSTSAVFTIGTLPFAPDNNNVGYQYAAGSFYAQSFRWLGAGYNQNNLTAGQVTPVINQTSGVWGVAFMISESNNARSLVVNNAENGSSFIIEFEITYSTGT